MLIPDVVGHEGRRGAARTLVARRYLDLQRVDVGGCRAHLA